jgi:opine dehydrogenase
MNVAVLGGSNGAYATAADLALAGHRVRLWRRSAADLESLGAPPTLTVEGEQRSGKATLEAATADIAAAVEDAEMIIAPLPATSHADLALRLAPHLSEHQIVLLAPGTLGSVALAQALTAAGGGLPYAVAETATLPYLARKTGPTSVCVPVCAVNLPVGVFPASRSAQVLAAVSELYPATRPCADALDVALTNTSGPVIHPPLVLLNLGAIDVGHFDVHAAGTTDSARRLMNAVDGERIATRTGWGYRAPHYELDTFYDEARSAEGLYGKGARAKFVATGLWHELLSLEHRYVAEDVVLGLPLFESAARTAGVPTPAMSGLLSVFGVLLGRNLSGGGRSLEQLCLADLSLREIRAFLFEGWLSPLWARLPR